MRFYRAFSADRCEASHISLFRREQGPEDLREHLLSQDLIYVGGGSVISLLGVWRAHGIDEILREAWEAGVVLCGLSAGSLCWFARGGDRLPRRAAAGRGPRAAAVQQLRPLRAGLGAGASPTTTSSATGCGSGYAAEDGAALHFVGTELSRVVASRPRPAATGSTRSGERVVEMRIATAFLGDAERGGARRRCRRRSRRRRRP